MKNKQNKSFGFLKKLLALGGLVALVVSLFKKREEVKDVIQTVEKELKNTVKHVEVDAKKVAVDVKYSLHKKFLSIAKDYVIPHIGNNHHPKALRPKALTAYVIVILLVKIVVTGSLFFLYPNTGFVTSKITDELYTLTNQNRIENDLPPLIVDQELTAAAEKKVNDMVAKQYFAHIGPDGKKPWEWIDKSIYNFTNMGENLAMDFSSAKVVDSAFMQSPTHRANILHKEYTNIGIAMKVGEIDGRETIFLVQFFGKQKASPTLAVAAIEPNTPTEVLNNTESEVLIEEQIVDLQHNDTEPEVVEIAPIVNPVVEQLEPEVPVIPIEVVEEVPVEVINDDIQASSSDEILIANNNEVTTTTSTLVAKVDGITFSPSAQLVVVDQEGIQKGLVDLLVSWSRNFMTLMLVIISMLFIVNISVKSHIQHSHVIAHSLFVIAFIVTMLLTRIHILERFVV